MPVALTGALLAAYLGAVWGPRLERDAEAEHVRLVERHLDSVAESLVPLLLARQLDAVHENLSALLAKNDDWVAVSLADGLGRQLYPVPGVPPRRPRPDQRTRAIERAVSVGAVQLGRLAVTVDLAPGIAFGERRSAELRWLLAAIFAAVVSATFLTLELAVLRPLRQLAGAAQALAQQRFDAELPRARGDEVGSLVRSFSAMREELRAHQEKLLREIAVRGEAERALRQLNRELEERVSAEHLLQEQLLRSQKLESVGRLAGGVAHDFNNLLTVILGAVEVLREDVAPASPGAAEVVQEIRDAAERARTLTRQLLAFARRQVIAPVPLDLGEVVHACEALVRRLLPESVELRISTQPGLWLVRCDPGHVEQVILNLAVNARDAMPDGGRLSIEVSNVSGAQPGGGDEVRLVVRDTGVGMSAEVRARLFEPFFTTKPEGKGTGLGLATVYGIVAQSGGRISVASEPGAGATFQISLPRLVEAGPSAAAPVTAAVRRSGSETILLVEDEPAVRETAARALRRAGYRVVAAGDAAAALERCADPQLTIDLLVVDIGLPGVRGTRLADAAVRARPGVPVLLVSGHIGEEADRSEVATGGRAFLPKPFTPSALLERVRALLDERARVAGAMGGA